MKRLLRHSGRRRGGDPGNDPDSSSRSRRKSTPPEDSRSQNQQTISTEPLGRLTRGVSVPVGRPHDGGSRDDGTNPTAWRIDNISLAHADPLCIAMKSLTKTTVYPDRPISKSLVEASAGRGSGRRRNNDSSSFHGFSDHESSPVQVYYYEVEVIANQSSSVVDIAVGLMCEVDDFGAWPGELSNSIGWGSDGLYVNGRRLDAGQAKNQFRSGDIVGCGIELEGTQRVFFTRNGAMMVSPSHSTSFADSSDFPWYPVVSFRYGKGDILKGNFGTDKSKPFRWMGDDRMSIISYLGRGSGQSSLMSNLPMHSMAASSSVLRSQDGGAQSNSPSSYYSMQDLQSLNDRETPLSNGNQAILTGSMRTPTGSSGFSPGLSAHYLASAPLSPFTRGPNLQTSYYGDKSSRRRSLVEDDPADANGALHDHFNLNPTPDAPTYASSSDLPSNSPMPELISPQRLQSMPAYSAPVLENPSVRHSADGNEAFSSRGEQNRRQQRANRARSGGEGLSGSSHHRHSHPRSTSSTHSPSNAESEFMLSSLRMPASLPPPRSAVAGNSFLTMSCRESSHGQEAPLTTNFESKVASVAVASGDDVPRAKERANALHAAAKQAEIDGLTVRDLLVKCKADQKKLQLKLSNALEEADAIEDLEELFAVNDSICSAIDAGNEALKREKAQQKKKSPKGPTIEILVENEDVFSLICMLRAPNDKRTAAALALMKFARESEALVYDIRSSFCMHSFLTLFRTRGATDDLRAVASLAVAYILPSFVVSSQASSSIGLKIVECLRFLAVTDAVETDGIRVSRAEMLKAASMGVNVLWINAIQPLLLLESTKDELEESRPGPPAVRTSRTRGRAGGRMLDQGQESIEVRELTELAVTLITHLAKISHSPSVDPLDIGYNIVEQVCEADVARPIAVREGILTTLVEWIRSKHVEKVRPAASALRYLISINDKYMAGWIHSQVVNEGAVSEIVKLLTESVGHDVRVAVAQMISALCIAPHTRAAVVEARCVSYLVALLYEHSAPASAEMVRYAASALLQLAAGAMVRATALSLNGIVVDAATPDQRETVITQMIDGWAHGSFVQIILSHPGKLRSVSVEALRVLSEDTDETRQTRLQLCSAGAAEAWGKTLNDESIYIKPLWDPEVAEVAFTDPDNALFVSIKDVHEALRGLANILEPQKEISKLKQDRRLSGSQRLNPREMLMKGCMDVVKSGGLGCIMWISSLPCNPALLSHHSRATSADRMDLLDETCRLLANLSPLLLTDASASAGCLSWASAVYDALHGILVRLETSEGDENLVGLVELHFDALKGLGALARSEPLKIRIVDKSLPRLLSLKSLSGEKNELSTAASQVLLSLGFTEDEITLQVAGSSPTQLVDCFCLQRALLLQAMARAELRAKFIDLWQLPFGDIDAETTMKLMRQVSAHSNASSAQTDERSEASDDNPVIQALFENLTDDRESRESRDAVLEQYRSMYQEQNEQMNKEKLSNGNSMDDSYLIDQTHRQSPENNDVDLLRSHIFPLNDTDVEKDWILSHCKAIQSSGFVDSGSCPVGIIPDRIEKLLKCCFPSRLLRNDRVPFNDLRTESSFNFRALMMPQRRYFSFRREGQLLASLCEKQATLSDTDEVHWSLAFTNSTFAGEFVESLVQSLYLCPMITGLSFSRNEDWLLVWETEAESESEEGGGLLANLAGSLPPWVSHLTFDNVLQDLDLRALVTILDTMGKLSSGEKGENSPDRNEVKTPTSGTSQGKFSFIGIRNSPQISAESWASFFNMLGKSGTAKRYPKSMPLSSLTILDLSGNKLGDELASRILELVHDKESGCSLEKLDLSGNRIGRGTNMVRTLRSYTEYYRYNQKIGGKILRSGWKSSLQTLVLADNELFLGHAALEIFALLKHNALSLRFLDLSNNGLEGDTYQLLASSLLRNTSLCHLDLSSNNFSSPLLDLIFEHINGDNAESSLSFLLLENNSPPLDSRQRRELGKFLRKSRRIAITRLLNDHGKEAAGELNAISLRCEQPGSLGLIEEDRTSVLNEPHSTHTQTLDKSPQYNSLVKTEEGDNMITVLFSAPLVFADETNQLHPFAKLDFDMERELLWQCMKEASRDIDLTFDNAHHSRLLATLTKRCSCLHYSGHGHPNFLPFEDGMGGPNWFNVQDIKELIVRDGAAPFKFVFVSACHSGLAGETFASAGVPHVVCCQQEQELKDTAALAFTRSFYLALAIGNTVKESFEQGCKAVRATPNLKDPEKEMEKFVLLPRDGDHNVPVFDAKPVRDWPKQYRNHGFESSKSSRRRDSLTRMRSMMSLGAKSSELSTRNMMQEDPSPTAPQFFIGREVDMYYLLTALLKMKKRLVNVLGEPGIGRSSLVCALCHYINERASTITEIQRIYFIKPRYGGRNVSCRSIPRQLLDKLQQEGKCRSSDDENEVEGMLDIISRSLRNEKVLIVFDRVELLDESDDAQELPMILSALLYETKQVKVVLTGKRSLGQPSIGGQVEHPFKLRPLNFANSVRLFGNLCPHLHTPSERGSFFTELIQDCDKCSHLFPDDENMEERTRNIFSMMGDGIPAKIEKAAYSISKENLNKLRNGSL